MCPENTATEVEPEDVFSRDEIEIELDADGAGLTVSLGPRVSAVYDAYKASKGMTDEDLAEEFTNIIAVDLIQVFAQSMRKRLDAGDERGLAEVGLPTRLRTGVIGFKMDDDLHRLTFSLTPEARDAFDQDLAVLGKTESEVRDEAVSDLPSAIGALNKVLAFAVPEEPKGQVSDAGRQLVALSAVLRLDPHYTFTMLVEVVEAMFLAHNADGSIGEPANDPDIFFLLNELILGRTARAAEALRSQQDAAAEQA